MRGGLCSTPCPGPLSEPLTLTFRSEVVLTLSGSKGCNFVSAPQFNFCIFFFQSSTGQGSLVRVSCLLPCSAFWCNSLCMDLPCLVIIFWKRGTVSFLKKMFSLILEGERQKQRCERDTSVGCLPYAPGLGTNPKPRMCPDQEPHWQPCGAWGQCSSN